MADLVKYRACMGEGMKGKHLAGEERRLEFCTLAKICSGKTKSKDEAKTMCLEGFKHKPPKSVGRPRKSKSCEDGIAELVGCMVKNIDMDKVQNPDKIHEALTEVALACACK